MGLCGSPGTELAPGAISRGSNGLWNPPQVICHDVFCVSSGSRRRVSAEAGESGRRGWRLRPGPALRKAQLGGAGIWNPFGTFLLHRPLFPGETHAVLTGKEERPSCSPATLLWTLIKHTACLAGKPDTLSRGGVSLGEARHDLRPPRTSQTLPVLGKHAPDRGALIANASAQRQAWFQARGRRWSGSQVAGGEASETGAFKLHRALGLCFHCPSHVDARFEPDETALAVAGAGGTQVAPCSPWAQPGTRGRVVTRPAATAWAMGGVQPVPGSIYFLPTVTKPSRLGVWPLPLYLWGT